MTDHALPWYSLRRELENALQAIAAGLPDFAGGFAPDVRPADPRFGDFQANGVLPFAKAQRRNPRELAATLLAAARASGRFPPEHFALDIAGPGFLNFRLTPAFLLSWLEAYSSEDDFRAGASSLYAGQTIVVDYSSPNTAKQMHVGHIRSTVIGEAICRLLAFCGATVIRDNHIGDWGTQFGLLIMVIKRRGVDLDQLGPDPIAAIETLYKEGSRLTAEDPAALAQAREELVRLQQGDPVNTALWQKITEISWRSFQAIYDLLDIRYDLVLGESFYCALVDRVYRELSEDGIATESQGALVVFHPEHPRFKEQPMMLRKSDGASNYATTDMATALYRVESLHATSFIILTDTRQKDHFEQVFLTAEKWFRARGYPLPAMHHVTFGSILGEDGRAIKTRSGEPILLKDLLQEGIDRAFAIVTEKNPDLPEDERRAIARVVGLGAIRYADLSQNRSSDYKFQWDKLLSFEGNTAPYLLYAAARIHSIFRKAGLQPAASFPGATPFSTPTEIALARKILGFADAIDQTLSELRPHFLGTYLFELAGDFSSFFNADKVLTAEPDLRARRLLLCARTLAVLEAGLHLLGLPTLQRM